MKCLADFISPPSFIAYFFDMGVFSLPLFRVFEQYDKSKPRQLIAIC